MIRVRRSTPEPPALTAARAAGLARLRALPRITPDDIKGYNVVRATLCSDQHYKCCYCEQTLEEKHRPVEHFRPKSVYWWLAWTWENLLFRHIQFMPVAGRWLPFPRAGSPRGTAMIRTCNLMRPDLARLYNQRAQQLLAYVRSFRRTLDSRDTARIQEEWREMLDAWIAPHVPFAGMNYDIIDHSFPVDIRALHTLTLREPI